jgi:hypothetical protein
MADKPVQRASGDDHVCFISTMPSASAADDSDDTLGNKDCIDIATKSECHGNAPEQFLGDNYNENGDTTT